MATREPRALDDLRPIALPVLRVSGLTGPSPRRPRVLLYTERGLALEAAAARALAGSVGAPPAVDEQAIRAAIQALSRTRAHPWPWARSKWMRGRALAGRRAAGGRRNDNGRLSGRPWVVSGNVV